MVNVVNIKRGIMQYIWFCKALGGLIHFFKSLYTEDRLIVDFWKIRQVKRKAVHPNSQSPKAGAFDFSSQPPAPPFTGSLFKYAATPPLCPSDILLFSPPVVGPAPFY